MWFPVGGPVPQAVFPLRAYTFLERAGGAVPRPAHADTKLGKLGPCFPPGDPPPVSRSPPPPESLYSQQALSFFILLTFTYLGPGTTAVSVLDGF